MPTECVGDIGFYFTPIGVVDVRVKAEEKDGTEFDFFAFSQTPAYTVDLHTHSYVHR